MSFIKEFKTFAMRGNVVDMAVGIIIGGAFGKIVSSLVSDIIMPPVGLLIGGVKFENLKIVLKKGYTDAATGQVTEAVSINYGNFIDTALDFLIIAFSIFLFVTLSATYVSGASFQPMCVLWLVAQILRAPRVQVS